MTPQAWFFTLAAFLSAVGVINNIDAAVHNEPNGRWNYWTFVVVMVACIAIAVVS